MADQTQPSEAANTAAREAANRFLAECQRRKLPTIEVEENRALLFSDYVATAQQAIDAETRQLQQQRDALRAVIIDMLGDCDNEWDKGVVQAATKERARTVLAKHKEPTR